MNPFKTMTSHETRILQNSSPIVRDAVGGAIDAVIAGIAIPYDKWTRIHTRSGETYLERIKQGALTTSLTDGREVLFLLNHDSNLQLGSTRTGLRLIDMPDGLHYEFSVDITSDLEARVFSDVQSGLIQKCSFEFKPIAQQWEDTWNGISIRSRTLTSIELFEISLVSDPAYSSTSAKATANFGVGQRGNGIETAHSRSIGREFAAYNRSQL